MPDAIAQLADRLSSIEAFVFDFYGTLVEDDVTFPSMWQELTRLGYLSSPDLQAIFEPDGFDGCTTPTCHSTPSHGDWNRANWRRFVALSGVSADDVDAVLDSLLDGQREYRATADVAAHRVLDLVRASGWRVGLCSNWETPIGPYLQQAQLPPFDAVSISAEVGARKPHLAMFQDICSKLGVEPQNAVFVGDNWWSDIGGALRAGLHPVWIRRNRSPSNLNHLVAEFSSLTDLAAWLINASQQHAISRRWTLSPSSR